MGGTSTWRRSRFRVGVAFFAGALLGPEGSGRLAWVLPQVVPAVWAGVACVGLVFFASTAVVVLARVQGLVSRSLLENCTVDASIFIFVVKLVRAHGGCLGTRSR
jgi:hypothetical protein